MSRASQHTILCCSVDTSAVNARFPERSVVSLAELRKTMRWTGHRRFVPMIEDILLGLQMVVPSLPVRQAYVDASMRSPSAACFTSAESRPTP